MAHTFFFKITHFKFSIHFLSTAIIAALENCFPALYIGVGTGGGWGVLDIKLDITAAFFSARQDF